MKKTKPKKIRKVWVIKPKSRVHLSRKREIRERIEKKEGKEGSGWR